MRGEGRREWGLGFGGLGSQFRGWGLGFRDKDLGFEVLGFGFWGLGSTFETSVKVRVLLAPGSGVDCPTLRTWSRVWGLGFRDSGFGIRVSGFGIRVSGFRFQVPGLTFRVSNIGLDGFACDRVRHARVPDFRI